MPNVRIAIAKLLKDSVMTRGEWVWSVGVPIERVPNVRIAIAKLLKDSRDTWSVGVAVERDSVVSGCG